MSKVYCIFSAQYLPSIGGVEKYTYNISKKLIEKGNKVIIVTSNVHNLPEHEITSDGIEIYRLPCLNLLNGRFPVLKLNRDFFRLNKMIKKIKSDLVIVNTRFYIHSLYGARLAKKQKLKCITIEHGTQHLTIDNKFFDALGQMFEHFITKCVTLYCKEFYGVSEACNEWLDHFNIKAKSTVYNAIDLDEVNTLLNNPVEDYRKDFNISDDKIVISFTGRLVKEKGILNLIEAVKKVNETNKNVYLIIAGNGILLDRIKGMATENIIVLGQVTFDKIVALLRQSNIFCLPSESEGFPTSVLEAVACKNFVITTERGGAKELIISDDYGIIMNTNDTETIYDNLMKVLNNAEYRKSAIEKSYDRLKENFTWDQSSQKVERICSEMNK